MFTFQCPVGWTAFANSCYIVIHANTYNRSHAINICQNEGGFLAVITSAAERDATQSLLSSVAGGYVYVDGTDAEVEGTWKTQTGETIAIPFEAPAGSGITYPSGGSIYNCLHMNNNELRDYPCRWAIGGALCEMNL